MADLIMENNNVTVKAEAEDFPPAEITFNIKKPTRLTGKKGEEYSNQSNIGFGITGYIIITVHPTSVSFSNCGIMRKMGVPSLTQKNLRHLNLTTMIPAIREILLICAMN
ncbi:MAG: hypothetical protein EGS44_10125 [Akkermansia muciniphila]|nr:hypothetical protein [Akkermansia muciniphila]